MLYTNALRDDPTIIYLDTKLPSVPEDNAEPGEQNTPTCAEQAVWAYKINKIQHPDITGIAS